jgi:hypothetical protein
MALCSCGLPACCCQPAVAVGFIYADLCCELSTHLAPAGFVYSEVSCAQAAATSFPLSKHTGGGDTAPTFSDLHIYLQLMWEVGLPPSPVEFSSHCCFDKLSRSWLLVVCCCSSWSVSSQAIWALASGGGPGALLVCLFNVKWRCCLQAGGVEGSKFCLFLVVLPVRFISNVSPRFYFWRHSFCFLPLAAILESPTLMSFISFG